MSKRVRDNTLGRVRKRRSGPPTHSRIAPEELERLKQGYGGYNWSSEIRDILRRAK
jgi:hypothetical protein